jgi:hypothetical protein
MICVDNITTYDDCIDILRFINDSLYILNPLYLAVIYYC